MTVERTAAENDLTVPSAKAESGMIFQVLPDVTWVKDISALKSLKLKESLEWLFNAMIENSKFDPIEEVKNNNLV